MKKLVGHISKIDADRVIGLYCNQLSLETLLEINSYEIDQREIRMELDRINHEVNELWEHIFNTYNIPHYINYTYSIDHVSSAVFVEV